MSKPDKIRNAILQAALKIAPFEGWTALTLKRAVREAGYPDGMADLYFEGGVGELLTFWSSALDRQAELSSEQRFPSGCRINQTTKRTLRHFWMTALQMS